MYGYNGRIIYLQREERKKLTEFFEKELGITHITSIHGEGVDIKLTTFDGHLEKTDNGTD